MRPSTPAGIVLLTVAGQGIALTISWLSIHFQHAPARRNGGPGTLPGRPVVYPTRLPCSCDGTAWPAAGPPWLTGVQANGGVRHRPSQTP